ncbi:hypothetical protein H2198_009519 [Neophaeococcomyces mojaviensis]|uniref:Uncharacterized protein n=1 Tax=Neophaeococcomyces mojaviensis TaxID=3383035 RepID=A0ACC2ZU35_9EURO|nr:hypothetical protein H2198_009519 [Knufia sp. JES_112]
MLWGDDATAPVMTRALASHERHAERLGYPMKVLRYSLANHYWNKVYWLQEIIVHELSKPPNERLEWLMWADADTILLNPSFHLEAFLPPHDMRNIHFICAKDWNGLNNGVFFIRVSEETAEYVARVIAYPLFKPEVHLEWPEQSAMQLTFNESAQYHEQVAYMPQHWFNGYIREVQPGDLLAHFAGVDNRHEEMDAWLDKIEGSDAADWDIYDPWSPSLHKRIMEIGHFWEIVKNFRGIAAKMSHDLFEYHGMHIADMPAEVYSTIVHFKDASYFSTDDEGDLARALMAVEDAVKSVYDKELPALLKYNPEWRLLMRNERLDDGAFQKPTKLEEFH